MAKIVLQSNASGNGTLTISAPSTNTDFTLNIPAESGSLLTSTNLSEINVASNTLIANTTGVFTGTLLSGKTTVTVGNIGCELRSNGQISATRSGSTTLALNRLTDDGPIATFYRSNTVVGNIGVNANRIYLADDIQAGISFASLSNGVVPVDSTGNLSDAQVVLGNASARFSDFYLSGSIYLGGTGAANALDDYEEGTWTPVFKMGSTVSTLGSAEGTYTKIGRLVFAHIRWNMTARNATTGAVSVTLPFTVADLMTTTGLEAMSASIFYQNVTLAHTDFKGTAWNATNEVRFYRKTSSTGTESSLDASEIADNFDGRLSIVYQTT